MVSKDYIKARHLPKMENLLLILTDIQQRSRTNSISHADMAWVADYLNTTLSSVYGVVKYYTMFSTTPRGKFVIRVCQSPVCRMLADGNLTETLEKELATADGRVTDDGMFSVEEVECLGHCEKAPTMMVNEEVFGKLSTAHIQNIVADMKKKI